MAACMFGERCEALPKVSPSLEVNLTRRFVISTWQAAIRRAGYLTR
jgi:hypothetical protein